MSNRFRVVVLALTGSFWLSVSAVAEEPLDEIPPLQPCCPTEWTTPTNVQEDGYEFVYRSGTAKNCRVYKVKNSPGGVLTPLNWYDPDTHETFMKFRLPACKGEVCKWNRKVRDNGATEKDKTHLDFGFDKSEKRELASAFKYAPKQAAKIQPIWTIFDGTVANSDGQEIRVPLAVGSFVFGDEPPFRIAYVFQTLVPGRQDFHVLSQKETLPRREPLGVRWDIVRSERFRSVLTDVQQRRTSKVDGRVIIRLTAKKFERHERLLVRVYQGAEEVLSTTAPAYLPAQER